MKCSGWHVPAAAVRVSYLAAGALPVPLKQQNREIAPPCSRSGSAKQHRSGERRLLAGLPSQAQRELQVLGLSLQKSRRIQAAGKRLEWRQRLCSDGLAVQPMLYGKSTASAACQMPKLLAATRGIGGGAERHVKRRLELQALSSEPHARSCHCTQTSSLRMPDRTRRPVL